MGWLDIFKRRVSPKPTLPEPPEIGLDEFLGQFPTEDYLGKAAEAGHSAKLAVKERRFDDAWRLYATQKQLYMQHAKYYEFTGQQTLALDASVSEHLANILRIEKKHDDALVHILYCALNSRPTKSIQSKLPTYFKRCNFQKINFDLIEGMMQVPTRWTFTKIREHVRQWRAEEAA